MVLLPFDAPAEDALCQLLGHLCKVPKCLQSNNSLILRRAVPRVESFWTLEDQDDADDEGQPLQSDNTTQLYEDLLPSITKLDAEVWSISVLQHNMLFHSLTAVHVQQIRLSDGINMLNKWLYVLSNV